MSAPLALHPALLALLASVDVTHKVFGAPGDYGYETPQGKALFALYRSCNAAASALHHGNNLVLRPLTNPVALALKTLADEASGLYELDTGGVPKLYGGFASRIDKGRTHWLCMVYLTDQHGRQWSRDYWAVTDDFGNLVEVPAP